MQPCKYCQEVIIDEEHHKCDLEKVKKNYVDFRNKTKEIFLSKEEEIKDLKGKLVKDGLERHKLRGKIKKLEELVEELRFKRNEMMNK